MDVRLVRKGVATGSTGLINTLDKAFLRTWLLSVPAPSDTGTPPGAACGGLYTDKQGRTTLRRERVTHGRRDTSRDKLCVSKGNWSCRLETLQTALYLCGVFILDGKAGIPGGAAEGIRASDPHLPTPPTTLQRKLFLSSCSF